MRCRQHSIRCLILLCIALFSFSLEAYAQIQVGFGIVSPDSGNGAPTGSVLFRYTNESGVVVSEAGVGAATPLRKGRIFVDEQGARTALALANPSSLRASVSLTLRGGTDVVLDQRSIDLAPNQQVPQFVDELFAKAGPGFIGSLSFDSDQPLGAITLRESRNAQNEPIYTTLPVASLETTPPASIIFPQIAVGDGYTTQLVMINTTNQPESGQVRFITSAGNPLVVGINGVEGTTLSFGIAPNAVAKIPLTRTNGLAVGYAVITADPGVGTPAGSAIFQVKDGDSLITEAGVGASPATTAARIFVDYAATRTGIAIANPSDQPVDLTFTLMDRFGNTDEVAHQTLAARNHTAMYVHELFPSVVDGFTGLLDIRSSGPIVPITLKLTINSRDQLVLTTLPVADLTQPAADGPAVFPHLAIGSGFSTHLILLNADTSKATTGLLQFYKSDGSALTLPMSGQTGSQFNYQLPPGGGRSLYPGDNAGVAAVLLVDASSGQPTSEAVINQGSSMRPRFRVIDSTGATRSDFDVVIGSLDSSVAAVDRIGTIRGIAPGFSTLTLSAGGVLRAATATVVRVDSGVAGFQTAGIVQDAARRLYLTSATEQVVLLAQDVKQTPQVYAGIPKSAGLTDGPRTQARFNNPSFLTLNQSDGSLYVSDAVNHVIRRVTAGSSGRVETLAGSGDSGNRDGSLKDASFVSPQGIALDERGNLWIADSASHTIRRINLGRGTVETVAGLAGTPGFVDGKGSTARFNSPAGIAVEIESAAQQLARQAKGTPPPPASILVADTRNGVIRRVRETGDVETVGSIASISGALSSNLIESKPTFASLTSVPALFASPAGVAIDASGTIYVAEPDAGRVRAILRNGDVVSAAQAGTFSNPQGVVIAKNGEVVVAGGDRAARQLAYGAPRIASITPSRIGNRGDTFITIKGSNFAPDSSLIIAGTIVNERTVADTQTITFTAPPLPSGLGTLTVLTRGGTAQAPLTVDFVPLNQLPAGYITTVVGGSTYASEGTTATSAQLNPFGIALDSNGNLLVVDTYNRKVQRVDSRSGILTTVAGNGEEGEGVSGPAIAASLQNPRYVAFDPAGNLLISGQGVRKVDAATGNISLIVGSDFGFCGDGENALAACFDLLTDLAVDANGNIFLADSFNHRVRRVDAKTNIITTIAGNGEDKFSGDNGDAKSAALNTPVGLVIDNAGGYLYIADSLNNRVRRVDLATNRITTVAGGASTSDDMGDGLLATSASLRSPTQVALDASGNLFIADRNHQRIRKVDATSGIITTVAGGGYATADGVPATEAYLGDIWGLEIDGAGNILISDESRRIIHKVDARTQIISIFAGNGTEPVLAENTPAVIAKLRRPEAVAIDRAGNLLYRETGNPRIHKMDNASGLVSTYAGDARDAVPGIGDGGPAIVASLATPSGHMVSDSAGNVYIADRNHFRIRRIEAVTNIITTIAGNGQETSSGDGGRPLDAGVLPDDLALDKNGNLYFAENSTRRVRKISLAAGTISTVAGGGTSNSLGDNGPALSATLGSYLSIAVDPSGNLLIADTDNRRIRKVDSLTQIITTIGGGGDDYQDGARATSVTILPVFIEVDSEGNIYFIDYYYYGWIKRISPTSHTVHAVAGLPNFTELGDNGPATNASLAYPIGLAFDAAGNLFIADQDNGRIRAVRAPIP